MELINLQVLESKAFLEACAIVEDRSLEAWHARDCEGYYYCPDTMGEAIDNIAGDGLLVDYEGAQYSEELVNEFVELLQSYLPADE